MATLPPLAGIRLHGRNNGLFLNPSKLVAWFQGKFIIGDQRGERTLAADEVKEQGGKSDSEELHGPGEEPAVPASAHRPSLL